MEHQFTKLLFISTATSLFLAACGSDSGSPVDDEVPQASAPVLEDTVAQPSGVSGSPVNDAQQPSVPVVDNNDIPDVSPPDSITEAQDPVSPVIDTCLLYTSPSPRDLSTSRMPSSA